MKSNLKTAFFFALAFFFLVGCQGQYPEKQIAGECENEVNEMVADSARMVIMYHPLDKAVKVSSISGYHANHEAFYLLKEFPIYTYSRRGELLSPYRFRFYVESFYDQLIQSKDYYKCGFYQIRIYEQEGRNPLFTKHFVKCNPDYLGRN